MKTMQKKRGLVDDDDEDCRCSFEVGLAIEGRVDRVCDDDDKDRQGLCRHQDR